MSQKSKMVILNNIILILFFLPYIFYGCVHENKDLDYGIAWAKDGGATWSPDGKKIAYTHGGKILEAGIYLINPDGSDNEILIKSHDAYQADWSPDGKWLAFTAFDQIWKYNIASDSIVQLTNTPGGNFEPSWSPDGKRILYTKSLSIGKYNAGIWISDNKGINHNLLFINAKDPCFESNELSLLYRSWPWDNAKLKWDHSEIYRFCFIDSSKTRLTNMPQNCENPAPSPDGKYIVFEHQINDGGGFSDIHRINIDGTGEKLLAKHARWPAWSPDGEWIVYTSQEPGDGRLWKMRKDGSDKKPVTQPVPDGYFEEQNQYLL